MTPAFAIWLTGLPASGKSTLAAELARQLESFGVRPTTLESDAARKFLTPLPTYSEAERDLFYGALTFAARALVERGIAVIVDATAHRRSYRDRARAVIPNFLEVYVDCPLDQCVARDPKGIYARGQREPGGTVPGLHVDYEPPMRPEVVVRTDRQTPHEAARQIVDALRARGWISASPDT